MSAGVAGSKRILFVGAESAFFVTHRLPLALAARERGYDVHVATPPGRLQEVIQRHELPWHPIILRRKPGLLRDALSVLQLTFLYWRLRPDLVHHIALKAVFFGTLAARAARVPAVVNAITGLGYSFDARREKQLLGRAIGLAFSRLLRHRRARFIFQQTDDRDIFLRRGWIAPWEVVLVRGSGVDPTIFFPAEPLPEGTPLVIFASRLLASKGAAEFVEAARQLKAQGVEARFAVLGEPDPGSRDTMLQSDLDAWKMEGTVEVWGRRSDMPAVLREASLFVLPTYYREGVPKALIEAAATGLPAITTDTPGCRDIVADGETGLLVPPRNVGALVDAIAQLLCDPERRRRMGQQARQRVLAEFTLEFVVKATLATYDALLREAETASASASDEMAGDMHDGRGKC